MKKKDIFEIIESYYLAQLLLHFNDKGLFKQSGKQLIRKDFTNPHIFQFLHTRTDIFITDDDTYYEINSKYHSYLELGFHIEKFLGAYGEFNLAGPEPFIVTNEKKFADAFFSASAYYNFDTVLGILADLKVTNIIDLGCGAGGLLVQFCKAENANRAIGIDQNPYLCQFAQSSIKKNRLTKAAKVVKGNVTDFDQLLQLSEINSIEAIYGSSILNEFFYNPKELIKLIKKLKKKFPNKYLIVSDYYNNFLTSKNNRTNLHHSYVHDVMQILSKQGLPPENYVGWNEYYEKANCHLQQVYEGTSQGINWFIHVVKLGKREWIM